MPKTLSGNSGELHEIVQPSIVTAICSRWLAESNAFSDTCPDRRAPRATWSIHPMPKGEGRRHAGQSTPAVDDFLGRLG